MDESALFLSLSPSRAHTDSVYRHFRDARFNCDPHRVDVFVSAACVVIEHGWMGNFVDLEGRRKIEKEIERRRVSERERVRSFTQRK